MAVLFDIDEGRWRRRHARTRAGIIQLRTTVDYWMTQRRKDEGFLRFRRHFDLIEYVVKRMLDQLDKDLATPVEPYSAGYELCRLTDSRVATVRSLFRWYSDKYDQRANPLTGGLLRAADEVVLSCWQEAIPGSHRTSPSGPLCYLRSPSRIDNLRRHWVPRELAVAADNPLAPFIEQLPVPVIGLPESVVGEPWWLTAVAHETGHLVQADLDLDSSARDTLARAGGESLGSWWADRHAEVFADAFATLMVGEAASWAVLETESGDPARLVKGVTGYPPVVVRVVLMGELIRNLGGASDVPGVTETVEWLSELNSLEARTAAGIVNTVPAVADAMLCLTIGNRRMRDMADMAVVSGSPRRNAWANWLTGDNPVFGDTRSRLAVRMLLAAGVLSYRRADPEADLAMLNTNLVTALADAGAPGLLAGTGDVSKDALADRLIELLLSDREEK